jgi:hypothetical protein
MLSSNAFQDTQTSLSAAINQENSISNESITLIKSSLKIICILEAIHKFTLCQTPNQHAG